MSKSVRKKLKTKVINLMIPLDVLDFYKRVEKATNVKVSKIIEIISTIEAIKIIDKFNKESKPVKRKRK